MKNILSKVFVFAVGAAIGSAVTWKLLDAKYHRMAEDEIEEVREYYKKKNPNYEGPETIDDDVESEKKSYQEKPSLQEYAEKLKDMGYTNYSKRNDPGEIREEERDVEGPYVIEPEEYGELHDYTLIELYHYADGILADDGDAVVEDADDIVGPDYADHFGDYEDDSVFIRNDARKCDYQILLIDRRYYGDIVPSPHQAEE